MQREDCCQIHQYKSALQHYRFYVSVLIKYFYIFHCHMIFVFSLISNHFSYPKIVIQDCNQFNHWPKLKPYSILVSCVFFKPIVHYKEFNRNSMWHFWTEISDSSNFVFYQVQLGYLITWTGQDNDLPKTLAKVLKIKFYNQRTNATKHWGKLVGANNYVAESNNKERRNFWISKLHGWRTDK